MATTGDIALEDVHKAGFNVDKNVVRKLPNFRNITIFLQKKTNLHWMETERMTEKITEAQTVVSEKLAKMLVYGRKIHGEQSSKSGKLESAADDILKEV